MNKLLLLGIYLALFLLLGECAPPRQDQKQACGTPDACEAEAKAYLEGHYETEASRMCRLQVEADWAYNTDLTNVDKEQALTEANIAHAKFIFEEWDTKIKNYNYQSFQDPVIKRQLKFLNIIGTAALNDADLTEYNTILGNMARVYGTAKICPFENQICDLQSDGLNLEPEIETIMSTSSNSEELAYVWTAWRDATGKLIREDYKKYIELANKAAQANELPNNGDLWLARYEAPDFRDQVAQVWDTVKDLYADLYGYVRFKLRQKYPGDFQNENDPIPTHLLGNMWAQSWEALYPLVIPHPDAGGFDITEKLKVKFENVDSPVTGVRELFAEANEFFTGLGLADMAMSYGDDAMIVRPTDGTEVTCHASAWDFCDKQDMRIKMCTNVNQEDYTTVHHELGHIEYFLMYKDQPITFRDGANPGFHEAIGDVISLSVATPKHFADLGYLDSPDLTPELTENFLMLKALEKIAFLPFGYLIDAYRWKLFDGTTSLDRMEYEWIKIRNEIQGLRPSTPRSEDDFDPGAKYHVPGNTPYIRYFVSFIIQFQIHKALCIAANQYDPSNPNDPDKLLYNCDIKENPAAGEIMKKLLEKGFSENWQDILQEAIGAREMDGSAIKEYFAPLTAFFKQQEQDEGYLLEWNGEAFEDYYEPSQGSSTSNPGDGSTSSNPGDGSTSSNPGDGSTSSNPGDGSTSSNPGDGSTSSNPGDGSSTNDDGSTKPPVAEERSDKINTGMIIVGIIQGSAIVLSMGAYVIKTFILKR